jgi:hypothetical protein
MGSLRKRLQDLLFEIDRGLHQFFVLMVMFV